MGKSTPSPDTAGIENAQASAAASKQEYELGSQQLAFEKRQWGQDQPIIQQDSAEALAAEKQSLAFSKQQENAYTNNFLPLEKSYANEAKTWASPAEQTLQAGAAESNVSQNMDASRNAATEQLEGYGVDPTSTRYAALDMASRTAGGAATAAAGTSAIQNTRMEGMALKQNAAAMGAGMAGESTSELGAGVGAGSAGANSTISGLSAGAGAMSAPTSWFNSGANNMNVDVNAVNGFNYAQNQASEIGNQAMAGYGSLAGGILGMFAEGGPVPGGGKMVAPMGATPGGAIPSQASPSGGQQTDDVPAMLTSGEFVMPKDVTQWYGQKFFVDAIDKARAGAQKLSQRGDIGGRPAQGAIPSNPAFMSRPPMAPQGAIPSQ